MAVGLMVMVHNERVLSSTLALGSLKTYFALIFRKFFKKILELMLVKF